MFSRKYIRNSHLQNVGHFVQASRCYMDRFPDSKVHGADMGPIWGRQDPGGPHVGPMNFAIWGNTVNMTGPGASVLKWFVWD